MLVKPALGRAVRWPGTRRLLAESGQDVPETSFWLLALHNGDVEKVDPSPVKAVSPPIETHEVSA
ncbi:hypothetical protein AA101099_1775 [Neoasaia chiangmaiensis NBRC 101099]|uniref:Uncharacterized protein n=1 Tax=Neoasaia chiangmaiensis TaxID=320497 RepID=A0A1U9KRA5_9PROT|nr:DUF2635 domain-containing protein [Neoasaia chiangmaiensis]AQS88269.1 hypothetical protein A0U93_10315 [Neoasaia chiangmaiensis]GBR39687.1 hypothetical protein AA101099_1775 [Neoasaia chiangmaiensis NBRC 101099]GEN14697.1 hypothetical protein NCH01_11280 [Neoasaia chiangmaiensis]